MKNQADKPMTGLILAGGGARAAYQVGVLKAIAEMLPRDTANPFPILCGTSAGAINATTIAIYATRFQEGVRRLAFVWRNFRVHQVFRTDLPNILSNGLRWIAAILFGGLGRQNPIALLDRSPLRRLLNDALFFNRIQESVNAGALHALSITASGYESGQSVSFYQGVRCTRSALRPRGTNQDNLFLSIRVCRRCHRGDVHAVLGVRPRLRSTI